MEARIIIQRIGTAWSKKSRGGKLAGERNGVPEALLLPLEKLQKSRGGLLEHSVAYTEWEGFSAARFDSLINVGLFKTLREDVFVSTEPTQVISQMARLW